LRTTCTALIGILLNPADRFKTNSEKNREKKEEGGKEEDREKKRESLPSSLLTK
jgi:hypothetical protein